MKNSKFRVGEVVVVGRRSEYEPEHLFCYEHEPTQRPHLHLLTKFDMDTWYALPSHQEPIKWEHYPSEGVFFAEESFNVRRVTPDQINATVAYLVGKRVPLAPWLLFYARQWRMQQLLRGAQQLRA